MPGPQVGYISIRDSIFGVGPTFVRITGMAQGDAIKITQPNTDGSFIGGSLGSGTFIKTEDNERRIELLLVPSNDDVTLLNDMRKLGPFPFKFEFGITQLQGFWMIERDNDIVVSTSPSPVMIAGPAWLANKKIGAQGKKLQ